MSIPIPTGRPPTNDTEETLLNPYLAWNTLRPSIPTAHPLHLVHNHAHFTYRVLTPDIAYDLDLIIPASPDNCQWSRYQRDLVANTRLYSLLWGTIRDLMMAQCNGRNMLS